MLSRTRAGGARHVIELAQAFERAAEFDILHCHVDYLAFPFGRLVRTPALHTLHGRLDLRHLMHWYAQFLEPPLISISDSQRAPLAALASTGWPPCATACPSTGPNPSASP